MSNLNLIMAVVGPACKYFVHDLDDLGSRVTISVSGIDRIGEARHFSRLPAILSNARSRRTRHLIVQTMLPVLRVG
jgi:hypothetical protein